MEFNRVINKVLESFEFVYSLVTLFRSLLCLKVL